LLVIDERNVHISDYYAPVIRNMEKKLKLSGTVCDTSVGKSPSEGKFASVDRSVRYEDNQDG